LNDFDGKEPVLLIIDDLMQETDETVSNLFTKGSHHRNVSVICLAQNLFPKNKFARTMSLNAHNMVLFKNPRDATQFANLARQMYPNRSQFAVEAYKDATREPYSYTGRTPSQAGGLAGCGLSKIARVRAYYLYCIVLHVLGPAD